MSTGWVKLHRKILDNPIFKKGKNEKNSLEAANEEVALQEELGTECIEYYDSIEVVVDKKGQKPR